MEPKYLGIVNNEQISHESGFVAITRDKSEIEDVVQDVLSERIKYNLEMELYYQGKEADQVDYSKVPDFVRKHTKKLGESERFKTAPNHIKKLFEESNTVEQFFLEAEEHHYKDEFGVSIEYEFLYNVEVYDLSSLSSDLKSKLSLIEPNKFIYLSEMDVDLELALKDKLDLSF